MKNYDGPEMTQEQRERVFAAIRTIREEMGEVAEDAVLSALENTDLPNQ